MSDRLDPNTLAWEITSETALRNERSFHELDGDSWVLEEYDEEGNSWAVYENSLRLTCYRKAETD